MNRRSLLALAAAAPALALPKVTAAEAPLRDLTHGGVIEWSAEARKSPLAEPCHRDLAHMLEEGMAPLSGDATYMDWVLQLRQPRFIVNMKPVWNTYTGWDPKELAPAALLIESGIEIGEFRTFRYHNPNKPGVVPDWARRAGCRKAHIDDYMKRKLERDLPGQLELDLRFLNWKPFTPKELQA